MSKTSGSLTGMVKSDWSQMMTEQIGQQLVRHRDRLGLSRRALSDRCRELGYPIPPRTIENLERARRDDVGVLELCVLGRALLVPPVLLIFPTGTSENCDPLPGATAPTWTAYHWFCGLTDDLPGAALNTWEAEVWADGAVALLQAREEDALIDEWVSKRASLANLIELAADSVTESLMPVYVAGLESKRDELSALEEQILHARTTAAELGVRLRPLPAGLDDGEVAATYLAATDVRG